MFLVLWTVFDIVVHQLVKVILQGLAVIQGPDREVKPQEEGQQKEELYPAVCGYHVVQLIHPGGVRGRRELWRRCGIRLCGNAAIQLAAAGADLVGTQL